MAKLPNPPAVETLAKIRASYQKLPAGSLLWRVYFVHSRYPATWNGYRFFGPTSVRFDHHLAKPSGQARQQQRGMHHAALDGTTALAEVFQNTRVINRSAKGPWIVASRTRKILNLLDLSGAFATRIGASMLLSSGSRARARLWSQALYQAYPRSDGLYYESSMHGGHYCVALYERSREKALTANPEFHRALQDPVILGLLRQSAEQINYGLI